MTEPEPDIAQAPTRSGSLDPPRAEGPGPGTLATVLATVGANSFLVFGSLVLGGAVVLLSWLPHRDRRFAFLARLWSRGLFWMGGVRIEVSFREELAGGGRRIYMPNHQSLYDIPVLFASLPEGVRFMAKNSLFRIPVFGWALRAGGFVSIDRKDRSQAGDAFAQALRGLKSGVSLVVFPEETRSRDGRILPFQRGGFLLAIKGDLVLVPVGIQGTGTVRPKGSWKVRPGRVKVTVGRPVQASQFGLRRKNELMKGIRDEVAHLAGATLVPADSSPTSSDTVQGPETISP